MDEPRKIVITGATGKQGGAVVRALLASPPPFPFEIIALTRSTTSNAAKSLASSPKVTLLEGDLDHCETIFEKCGGRDSVWGVFSVQVPSMKKGEEGLEERLGKNLIDAAVNNEVKHFVYASVERGPHADTDPTPVPHFRSKFNIEQHLKASAADTGMTYTILRPVAFMDNMNGTFGKVFAAMWRSMGTQRPLQLIATQDIGIFAALAFANPDDEDFKNKAIGLAGDELTQGQAGDVFIEVFKRPMPRYSWLVGSLAQWMIPEVGTMFKWFHDVGYAANIQECKRLNPQLKDVRQWMQTESEHQK